MPTYEIEFPRPIRCPCGGTRFNCCQRKGVVSCSECRQRPATIAQSDGKEVRYWCPECFLWYGDWAGEERVPADGPRGR